MSYDCQFFGNAHHNRCSDVESERVDTWHETLSSPIRSVDDRALARCTTQLVDLYSPIADEYCHRQNGALDTFSADRNRGLLALVLIIVRIIDASLISRTRTSLESMEAQHCMQKRMLRPAPRSTLSVRKTLAPPLLPPSAISRRRRLVVNSN
jgi:hypothetical protein